jgi:nucleotidyltransferase/DNA polymerase involved in DNA repair
MNGTRYIVHVDMDAFFASVEQNDNPAYGGKPVIVGSEPMGGKGRGVVSACSYEARKYGIHSAMPISTAYKKCPRGIFLPVNMRRYAEVSENILAILERFTPDLEPVSIDEAFLDITGSYRLFGTPQETCIKIKRTIKELTGLTASIGMAPNKMTAKIASDLEKPDGIVFVKKGTVREFLAPLPIGRLWGVGEKTGQYLEKIGIKTIGDIAKTERERLSYVLGKNGAHIWELANGIDERIVKWDTKMRSISNEHTFNKDTADKTKIQDTLIYLSEKVARKLRKSGIKARTITLKIRFADFRTLTRAVTIAQPTNFADILYQNALDKTRGFSFCKNRNDKVRLIGVKVSNFTSVPETIDLFMDDRISNANRKKEDLYRAIDKIKDRFGENAVRMRK